jgi:hypothetical protein
LQVANFYLAQIVSYHNVCPRLRAQIGHNIAQGGHGLAGLPGGVFVEDSTGYLEI